jgi:hypothetical protein
MIVRQIISHVEWAKLNPEAANRLSNRSNELFRRRLSLESMLPLMAGRTKFAFTAMATAVWHWRSTTKDNWTFSLQRNVQGFFGALARATPKR